MSHTTLFDDMSEVHGQWNAVRIFEPEPRNLVRDVGTQDVRNGTNSIYVDSKEVQLDMFVLEYGVSLCKPRVWEVPPKSDVGDGKNSTKINGNKSLDANNEVLVMLTFVTTDVFTKVCVVGTNSTVVSVTSLSVAITFATCDVSLNENRCKDGHVAEDSKTRLRG